MGAMAVFLRNKPLESLNRGNVHQQRCQHGLSLLNLYRDDKTKLLYHMHHGKNTDKAACNVYEGEKRSKRDKSYERVC